MLFAICNKNEGADTPIRPPTLHRPPCKNHVIAKPVRTPAVAIRIPRPQAPLPKGGWHGKAVPGGFFSRTQGTRALPYKVLHYRDWADRVVRPYEVLSVNGA